MSIRKRIAACRDPKVQAIRVQHFALELLVRGLQPKQAACITGLAIEKIYDLRVGLVPEETDRRPRPPQSTATILRRPKCRVAASMFVAVYQRVISDNDAATIDWSLFLQSYDIYSGVAAKFQAVLPRLAIDDAFTLVLSLRAGGIEFGTCPIHGTRYLLIPNNRRVWSCPYCSLAAEGWPEAA